MKMYDLDPHVSYPLGALETVETVNLAIKANGFAYITSPSSFKSIIKICYPLALAEHRSPKFQRVKGPDLNEGVGLLVYIDTMCFPWSTYPSYSGYAFANYWYAHAHHVKELEGHKNG
jgi:hypothetical protein